VVDTYAVVPSRDRRAELTGLCGSLADQVDGIVVINNGDKDDEEWMRALPRVASVRTVDMQPPNLSALLNIGAADAEWLAEPGPIEPWNLAYFNDDVLVPPGWVQALSVPMRANGAAAAFVDVLYSGGAPRLLTQPATTAWDALTGWAFLMRGELHERWDESMKWWWSDTDLDWRLRTQHGGVIAVPTGRVPQHLHPNGYTNANPVLYEQAGKDGETFSAKWRRPRPW